MKIIEAVRQIKEKHSIEYSKFMAVIPGNIVVVAMTFKDKKTMTDFVFAWSSAIRRKTDQHFSISTKYMTSTGDVQPHMACYRPHSAKRGCETLIEGQQRTSNEEE